MESRAKGRERPTEEGRKGGEAVRAAQAVGGSRGGGAAHPPSRVPESGWQKRRGQRECVPTASAT